MGQVSVKRSQSSCHEMTKCQSMGVICTESFLGWIVHCGVDQWLIVWFPSPQAVEADFMVGQIDFGTNEAMSPEIIEEISASLDLELTTIIRSTQVDHSALERTLVIRLPIDWKGASCGSRINARRCATAHGPGKAIGTILNRLPVLMKETLPDPDLPAAIEVLDEGLEAGLMRRGEDRDDAELQAEPDHTAEGIRKLTCPAENRVVVELGIVRQPVLPPMFDERFRGENSSPRRSHPGTTQSPMQTDSGQNVHGSTALKAKIFDEIKAVQFGLASGDAWQIPAFGRWGTTNSPSTVEGAATPENSSDGAQRGNLLQTLLPKGTPDCCGAIFAKIAEVPKLLANSQNAILHPRRGGVLPTSPTARPVEPNDPIETIVAGALDPPLNSSQSHTKLLRDRTLRASPSHGPNDLLTTCIRFAFCSRISPDGNGHLLPV